MNPDFVNPNNFPVSRQNFLLFSERNTAAQLTNLKSWRINKSQFEYILIIPMSSVKVKPEAKLSEVQLTSYQTFFFFFLLTKLCLQSDKCMQIDGKMSRALGRSDEADFVEIRDFHVCKSVDFFFFFRGFSLLSLPSVLQNNLWSAQFTRSSRRQTDGQTLLGKCDFLHRF